MKKGDKLVTSWEQVDSLAREFGREKFREMRRGHIEALRGHISFSARHYAEDKETDLHMEILGVSFKETVKEDELWRSSIWDLAKKLGETPEISEAGLPCFTNKHIGCGNCPLWSNEYGCGA